MYEKTLYNMQYVHNVPGFPLEALDSVTIGLINLGH